MSYQLPDQLYNLLQFESSWNPWWALNLQQNSSCLLWLVSAFPWSLSTVWHRSEGERSHNVARERCCLYHVSWCLKAQTCSFCCTWIPHSKCWTRCFGTFCRRCWPVFLLSGLRKSVKDFRCLNRMPRREWGKILAAPEVRSLACSWLRHRCFWDHGKSCTFVSFCNLCGP